ncbi:1-acylglycerol-3-phosphate O-acyltransferase ABHD5 [Danio rerio]|uniref:1-acylglycerol-3-phosphate O-acyltransferase ABHD5 n=1 Tax=Danio rerio TaxID=7955 RepID=A0A8M1RHW0_DANRE
MRTDEEQKELTEHRSGWSSVWWPSWCPTSPTHLSRAEDKILSALSISFSRGFVSVSSGQQIRTLVFNGEGLRGAGSAGEGPALVLLHGFGAAVGLWVLNLQALAQAGRPVLALDLLGFGRSSRPVFSTDPQQAEQQQVEALEHWRSQQRVESMILLGHHLGAYISAAYALAYPQRVKHLILVEPWGFSARPSAPERWVPFWIKVFGAAMNPFNPLALLRLAGPLGPLLLQLLRSDFKQKYSALFSDNTVPDYIYHINTQTASGEVGFKNMTVPYGWPQHPLLERMDKISPSLPISFIYGSRSCIDGQSGRILQEMRPGSHTEVIVIQGAGHYVFADQPEDFNRAVLEICNSVKHTEPQNN